jgi:hypothetical protein
MLYHLLRISINIRITAYSKELQNIRQDRLRNPMKITVFIKSGARCADRQTELNLCF